MAWAPERTSTLLEASRGPGAFVHRRVLVRTRYRIVISALSPEGLAALRHVAAHRPMLALDFDGTLAPIVDDPAAAGMREQTASLLSCVASAFPCAVISGRARADVLARVAGAPLVAVVGNHGIEIDGTAAPATRRARVGAWVTALRDALCNHAYIRVEDKGSSVAVHYRMAPAPELAEHRVRALASALPGARVFGGHAVVNVVPADSPTKGDAIATLAARLETREVVYVGDDETDEDAFRAPVVTVPIRVGHSPRSAARLFLHDQTDIDALLLALIDARRVAEHQVASAPRPDGDPE